MFLFRLMAFSIVLVYYMISTYPFLYALFSREHGAVVLTEFYPLIALWFFLFRFVVFGDYFISLLFDGHFGLPNSSLFQYFKEQMFPYFKVILSFPHPPAFISCCILVKYLYYPLFLWHLLPFYMFPHLLLFFSQFLCVIWFLMNFCSSSRSNCETVPKLFIYHRFNF